MKFEFHLITSKPAILFIVAALLTCGSALAADTTPPTLTITSPVNGGTYTTDETIMIAAEAYDASGINRVELLIDAQLLGADFEAPYVCPWDLSYVPEGCHTITVRAFDNAGNNTTRSITIYVVDSNPGDTTPPTLTITSPTDGGTYTTDEIITITAVATDSSGIDRVELYIDDAFVGADYTAPYTSVWNLSYVSLGAHTIKGTAYDNAGNYTTKSVTIVVEDDTEPEHPGQKKGKR